NNPNVRINNVGAIGFDSTYQIRAGFSYRMPYELQLSGSIREATGLLQTRVYIVPGLTQVTQGGQVAERGEFRYPWQNVADLRMTRAFRVNNVRLEPTI